MVVKLVQMVARQLQRIPYRRDPATNESSLRDHCEAAEVDAFLAVTAQVPGGRAGCGGVRNTPRYLFAGLTLLYTPCPKCHTDSAPSQGHLSVGVRHAQGGATLDARHSPCVPIPARRSRHEFD